MKVARISFFLGAQNFVDCLKRHAPTIQTPKITVTDPAAAIKSENKPIKLAGFAKIIGTKPTTKDGSIMTPIIMRCTVSAISIVNPCMRNLRRRLNSKPTISKAKTTN